MRRRVWDSVQARYVAAPTRLVTACPQGACPQGERPQGPSHSPVRNHSMCLTGRVIEVHVRPESIHLAAQKVDDAGQDWGESVHRLTSAVAGVSDPYGGDLLGAALKEMYETAGPAALIYFAETGFCVAETAIAMEQLADAYTAVEEHNSGQTDEVDRIIDSLGDL